jgi:hypothetical protein
MTQSWKDAVISLSVALALGVGAVGFAAYSLNQSVASAVAAPFKVSFKIS